MFLNRFCYSVTMRTRMCSETAQLLLYMTFACGTPILFTLFVYIIKADFFAILPEYLQDFGTQPGYFNGK